MDKKNPVANFYRASAEDFKKIPGSPTAYWLSNKMMDIFYKSRKLENIAEIKHGLSTGDNNAVVRLWSEISVRDFGLNFDERLVAIDSGYKWFPYNKGGDYRKWYGNHSYVVRYDHYGNELMNTFSGHRHDGKDYYFKEGVTWTFISSSNFASRYTPNGFVFDVSGSSIFIDKPLELTAFLCTKLCFNCLKALNPTLNFQVGNIKSLPIDKNNLGKTINDISTNIIKYSKSDWNSYETSWDFTKLPLLEKYYKTETISTTYNNLRAHWQEMTSEMKRLEEENNRIFIEAYGLEDELNPDVPLEEITLTCNPYYRYGKNKSEEDLEKLLLADTMREYISYAVGCIFGRYSIDKDGLVLANAGDDIEEYYRQIPKPTFVPDESGILPVTADEDYTDDLPSQFRNFLRTTFGDQNYRENISFIEDAIGKDIRGYFLKNFYSDHVKRYKKRPIYWMISSPNGSFKALIYLHRYHKDTINRFLNDYLRPYKQKLQAKIQNNAHIIDSGSYGTNEKNRAQKQITEYEKQLKELSTWEKDVVYPLASQRIELDLDDGVKVNYAKLGAILEKVKGLNA